MTMTANQDLGKKLKKSRQQQNLSREEISRETAISEEFIIRAEKGDFENNTDAYILGKLRFLANFLGWSAEEVGALYPDNSNVLTKRTTSRIKRDNKIRTPIVTSSVAIQALTLSALILMVGYLLWQVFMLASNPRLEVTHPEEDQTISSQEIDIVGYSAPGNEVTIDGQPVLVDDDGRFIYSVNLDDGVHVLNLEVRNNLGRVSELERTVIVETDD